MWTSMAGASFIRRTWSVSKLPCSVLAKAMLDRWEPGFADGGGEWRRFQPYWRR
jgi:hypothetical protein